MNECNFFFVIEECDSEKRLFFIFFEKSFLELRRRGAMRVEDIKSSIVDESGKSLAKRRIFEMSDVEI